MKWASWENFLVYVNGGTKGLKFPRQVEELDIKPAIEKSNLNSLVYVNGGISWTLLSVYILMYTLAS